MSLQKYDPVVPTDRLSIAELANIFGFPVSGLVEAINRQAASNQPPFLSISLATDRAVQIGVLGIRATPAAAFTTLPPLTR
jgi:hypothetical protein